METESSRFSLGYDVKLMVMKKLKFIFSECFLFESQEIVSKILIYYGDREKRMRMSKQREQ